MKRHRVNPPAIPESDSSAVSGSGRSREGIQKSRIHNLPELTSFRKSLRNQLTPAEAKLWTLLKGSRLDGRKFRRQHSVGKYVLDFYCPEERLAVELDGQVHHSESAVLRDRERDLFLDHCGIKILRFENRLVFEATEGVLSAIRNHFGWTQSQRPQNDDSSS